MRIDERVRADLTRSTRFNELLLLDETDSTNRVAADVAAAGAPEGLVVVADVQTAGRGRLDRRWDSRAGDGLLVSVLLRPSDLEMDRYHLLTAASAVAARDACARVASVEVEIKWPNDLIVGERKLAGILAESATGAVVVGMGMNVHAGPPGAAVLDQEAGRRIGRAELLDAWLRGLDALLGRWDRVAELYRDGCVTVGQRVRVELLGEPPFQGLAIGVDSSGRLAVRRDETSGRPDHVASVAAGDVVHLRPV